MSTPPPNTEKTEDKINHPSHYTQGSIEPLNYIFANDMNYAEGCIIKYITRYKYKNAPLEDLNKAAFYIQTLIKKWQKN
tara:strand:+ start:2656 stop:2892 length:237 start_codon:yes stop_codon:yes gene_type:complete